MFRVTNKDTHLNDIVTHVKDTYNNVENILKIRIISKNNLSYLNKAPHILAENRPARVHNETIHDNLSNL